MQQVLTARVCAARSDPPCVSCEHNLFQGQDALRISTAFRREQERRITTSLMQRANTQQNHR